MNRVLRLGARGSRLSLWQAGHATEALAGRGIQVELEVLSSSGDRDLMSSIEELEAEAPFADDLENALRHGDIDLAVHSLKDLAASPPPDLAIGALLPRGAITESLVSRVHVPFAKLPPGSVIGTCSSRRRAQVLLRRPDLVCRSIRGPVDDRVEQVRSGAFDAAILATAGLERLGLAGAITETFMLRDFAPAAGQGALAIQVRAGDVETRSAIAGLDHFATRLATTAEIAAQRQLEAAGQLAATYATVQHATVTLNLRVLSRTGGDRLDVMASGTDPDRVANEAAGRALERWAVAR
jgi:hydroxymethylbilane synthase